MKKRFPFKIGAPSELYPMRHVLDNVRLLAREVDFIELTLEYPLELPLTDEILNNLRRQKDDTGIEYSIHLPVFCQLASPNPRVREASLATLEEVFERTACLKPLSYAMHVDPMTIPGSTPLGYVFDAVMTHRHVMPRIRDSLRRVSEMTDASRVGVENIDGNYGNLYCNIDLIAPFIEEFGFSICMDVGHLIRHEQDPRIFFMKYYNRINAIHLHDVVEGKNHRLIGHPACKLDLRTFLALLLEQGYRDHIVLEVFDPNHLNSSKEALQMAWTELVETYKYSV
ncbi:MAG: cobamide remodeling phosphodiesterase CbiR [Bacillota bacterium]